MQENRSIPPGPVGELTAFPKPLDGGLA